MNTTINYTVDNLAKILNEVGGYDPFTEAKDLLDLAKDDDHFDKLLYRRINNHEPVSYITNHAKFKGLDIYIDRRVLIPRPETETLVDVAVQDVSKNCKVIDVGTGSGAVALAVKNERPDLQILGVDISKDALDVASINSNELGIKIDLKQSDLIEGIKDEYDCILANLPYLPVDKKDFYQAEMVDYEPDVALWGGKDGFNLTRRLLELLRRRKRVSLLALEVGLGQHEDVIHMIRDAGFPTVFCTTDAKGDIRCVVGKK